MNGNAIDSTYGIATVSAEAISDRLKVTRVTSNLAALTIGFCKLTETDVAKGPISL